jgi:hypothetical protein
MRKVFALFGTIALEGIQTVNKQMSELERKAKRTEREITKFGKNIEKVGKNLTIMTAPLLALIPVAYKGVQAASDLSETIAKTGEIFGESAKDIENWVLSFYLVLKMCCL